MARIFKISGYLVDANGDYDAEQLEVALKEDYDLIAHHIRVEERDIGEWDDDCPLNDFDCPKEECEKYFCHQADVAPKSEVDKLKETIERLEQEKEKMLVSATMDIPITIETLFKVRTEHPIISLKW